MSVVTARTWGRAWAWAPVVVYSATIVILSSISAFPVPRSVWRFDKLIHATEYAGLAVLLWRALRFEGIRHPALGALFGASLFGFSDEAHQYFTPRRTAEPLDWVADTVGAAVGLGVLWAWRRIFPRRETDSQPKA